MGSTVELCTDSTEMFDELFRISWNCESSSKKFPILGCGSGLPDATVKNQESGRQHPENPGIFPSKSGRNPERFLASFFFVNVRFFNQSINFLILNFHKIYFIGKNIKT
jgi:hypothetical protein